MNIKKTDREDWTMNVLVSDVVKDIAIVNSGWHSTDDPDSPEKRAYFAAQNRLSRIGRKLLLEEVAKIIQQDADSIKIGNE